MVRCTQPGDYTLTLQFDDGPVTMPMVVLDPDDHEPQVRMVGTVKQVVLARLVGLFFDTSKSFLLPSAMRGITAIKRLYDRFPGSKLLVVGHTDRAGTPSYNDVLSMERANSVAAFLKDEVDVWLRNYAPSVSPEKRWGHHEDLLMIGALADAGTRPAAQDPIRWFQSTRGLTVDGVAGPMTRGALIREYMGLDGTSLPEDIDITIHGCGENFPAVQTDDGRALQENRRVELFFFEDEIQPPPPGKLSPPGSTQYPAWVSAATEVHDFTQGEPEPKLLLSVRIGEDGMDGRLVVRDSVGTEVLSLSASEGVASPGVRTFELTAAGLPDPCEIVWQHEHDELRVAGPCSAVALAAALDANDQAAADRLVNPS